MWGIGGEIGCLAAALIVLAVAAPSAALASPRTVVQKPDEWVALELPAGHGKQAFVLYYPLEGVAVFGVEKGEREARRGRSSGAAFAVRTATRSAEDGIDASFGPLGTVSGGIEVSAHGQKQAEVGPQEGCRGKQALHFEASFSGTIALRVKGGYFRADASEAKGYVHRSYKLRCKKGKAYHPSRDPREPFSYLARPAQEFSSQESPILLSSLHHRHRWIEMAASTEAYNQPSSNFRAEALEWLPGNVATVRWTEASRVSPELIAFGTGAPPRTATLTPPAPFSGRAHFNRRSHSLRGDLAVTLPGDLRVRIGSPASRARVCDLELRRDACR